LPLWLSPLFTGNMNLQGLEETLKRGNVALVGLQSFADGQHPFSLENLRAIRSLADRQPLLFMRKWKWCRVLKIRFLPVPNQIFKTSHTIHLILIT
jgi:tryptophanase